MNIATRRYLEPFVVKNDCWVFDFAESIFFFDFHAMNLSVKLDMDHVSGMAELYNIRENEGYNWYAVYTRLFHEKAVEKSLTRRGITAYLPKVAKLRQWSDRRKIVEEPLFHSYVFVYVSNRDYHKALNTPSVLHYICFEGKPSVIPDNQIDVLRKVVDARIEYILSRDFIEPGKNVKILSGPLKGFVGEIICLKSKQQIILRIEQLNYSVLVDIDKNNLGIIE